jgi:hypothetical protein
MAEIHGDFIHKGRKEFTDRDRVVVVGPKKAVIKQHYASDAASRILERRNRLRFLGIGGLEIEKALYGVHVVLDAVMHFFEEKLLLHEEVSAVISLAFAVADVGKGMYDQFHLSIGIQDWRAGDDATGIEGLDLDFALLDGF